METNPLFPHPFCHPCSHSRFPLFLRAAQHKPRPSQELLKAFFSLPSFLQLLEGKQQPHSPFCAPGLGSWSPPGWWAGEVPRARRAGTASQQGFEQQLLLALHGKGSSPSPAVQRGKDLQGRALGSTGELGFGGWKPPGGMVLLGE